MHKIAITFDARQIKQIEALSAQVQALEVKKLQKRHLYRYSSFFRRFGQISMHVQYLEEGRNQTTLNLVNEQTSARLENATSEIFEAYRLLKPHWVSFHLGFSATSVRSRGCDMHNVAVSDPLSKRETFEKIVDSVRRVSHRLAALGYTGEILLENLDYHPTGAYEYVCCPKFIRRVLDATGSGLLLDLAHLVITSESLGVDPRSFVEEIGYSRIREVHVAAPLRQGARLYDINQPFFLCETTKRLLNDLVQCRREPLLFTLECRLRLAEQLTALQQILASKTRARLRKA